MSAGVVTLLVAALIIIGGLAFFAGMQWSRRVQSESTVRTIGEKVKEAAAKQSELRRKEAAALARRNPTIKELNEQRKRITSLLDSKDK